MEYDFREIEKKWQDIWKAEHAYRVENPEPGFEPARPKFYVLDMFPYPSGAGLHVGHPLGYIASDIFARFKRLKGYRVLHPMGYDAFGLPAEQYAIEHGIHPAVSTADNIDNFRSQLDKIGFCFDWDRAVNTSSPGYYKWTQWIFLQLFKSHYNPLTDKAESIETLISIFEQEGSYPVSRQGSKTVFTAAAWKNFSVAEKENILMDYRLAYCGIGEVNWCEALGTVLANDEVINGLSERGNFPVERKKLRQWYLRITEYADRLLEGLNRIDFSEAMKEMQTNWIGKSQGAEIDFSIRSETGKIAKMRVYTTRPDTIFGVDFMVVAPELEWVGEIISSRQKGPVAEYLAYVNSRSERERMAEKTITGCFTGAYAINPFDKREIPIWISEYVLAGYGTGSIMAVPCGDDRDFKFARHFQIPVTNIIGDYFNGEEANPTRDAKLINSDFLNGLIMRDAIALVNNELEARGIGKEKINYRMRDAAFSRQRYWGEPFPIIWKDGIAYPLDEKDLPLELPYVETYKPGPNGEGPLANVREWVEPRDLKGVLENGTRETNTMPGYAGSSWYFLRYMDPENKLSFCDRRIADYWGQVDLYIGGTEHAVGHLLYSRMWTKALYDLGYIGFDEPYKKLVNQGMIQGSSRFAYRLWISIPAEDREDLLSRIRGQVFVSNNYRLKYLAQKDIEKQKLFRDLSKIFPIQEETDKEKIIEFEFIPIHVDVNMVNGVELDIREFRNWRNGEYADAAFILETDGKFICGTEVEKMSKSKFNTVNPDFLVGKYGADTFRMYEMFLGPIEQSKPWDTKGIEGVHRFLRKLWRLFYDEQKNRVWNNQEPGLAESKSINKTIKKIGEDTERLSFNTAVSALMICVNELSDLKCHKKEVLEKLLIILTPYAPHIAEELWHLLGNTQSILDAGFPGVEEKYLFESTKNYPVAINGKTRTEMNIALDSSQEQVEALVLNDETVRRWLEGKTPKKIIYVKNKMINVVI
jgi:leucyl-tRNA synthetase